MIDALYEEIFLRNRLLWGDAMQDKLRYSQVALIGLGGVGSYVAEALARAGIGALTLVDHDRVELSNLNRQLPALLPQVGRPKVEVVGERIAAINPHCHVQLLEEFITEDNAGLLGQTDYFVDAIDYIPGKIAIINHARAMGKPVASALGAGRRVAPEQLRLADLSHSKGCPLARELRRRLRALGIESGITVVYSEERAQESALPEIPVLPGEKRPLGSSPFVPAVAGLLLASAVIRDLAGIAR